MASDHQLLTEFCSMHNDTYPAIDSSTADLTGSSVVITGASKGVGKATAIAFAKAGASKIAIAARSDLSAVVQEIKAAAQAASRPEPIVFASQLDVTAEEGMKKFAAEVEAQFDGKVDVLINNAGFLETWHPLGSEELNTANWWKSWEVNIRGPFLACQAFMRALLASERRTVINLTSLGAAMLIPGGSAYLASKMAICRLTEFLVTEQGAGDRKLTSFAIHPGGVATELGYNLPSYMHGSLTDTPELAADFMIWLVRDKRDWLNGRMLLANWDVTELESKRKQIEERDMLKFRMAM